MGALLGAAFLLAITIAGLTLIVAGLFPKVVDFAKTAFANSLKGFALALCCWIIINGVMNIVGYKHPLGGKWYQFECSSGTCTSSNKTLQSIKIKCSKDTNSATTSSTSSTDGSGFYVALDTLTEDGSGKTQQLKAVGTYSCDGTTSEEDITDKVEWKASDETQIKVEKGLVQAVTTSLGSSSETVPYVEAKYSSKSSNQAKVYINSCPNTKTANAETKNKLSLQFNNLVFPKAHAGVGTTYSDTCTGCGQVNTCPFVVGNENAENMIIFIRTDVSDFSTMPCTISKPTWIKGDQNQLKEYKEIVKEFSAGLAYTTKKNNFGVYRSDLINKEECKKGEKNRKAYIVNGTAPPNARAEAFGCRA